MPGALPLGTMWVWPTVPIIETRKSPASTSHDRSCLNRSIKNGEVRQVGDKRFIKMAEKFVNIDELNINLIDSVNPFQRAFEVMSKSVTPSVLRIIQDQIAATRVEFTEEEALALYPKIKIWVQVNGGKRPNVRSEDPQEKRMAEALLFLQKLKQQREAEKHATEMVNDA